MGDATPVDIQTRESNVVFVNIGARAKQYNKFHFISGEYSKSLPAGDDLSMAAMSCLQSRPANTAAVQ